MYFVRMTFKPFEKVEITENNILDMDINYDIWGYLGNLIGNGQIGDYKMIYIDDYFQAFFFIPELDSLDEKNCCKYGIESLVRLEKKCAVTYEVLGQSMTGNSICSCVDSSWYILYTHSPDDAISPIVCGDCLDIIPTYKFSHIELPKDCQPELGWQADFNLIDRLWYYSSFDSFTYRQMNSPKSQLSKSGREICANYEKALGKPFYYSLFQYAGKKRKKCPECKGDWTLKKNIAFWSYKCDKCRLISC